MKEKAKLFKIYFEGELVGSSRLESGDPPMGVACGQFQPEAAYSRIQHLCRMDPANEEKPKLIVLDPDGQVVPCVGAVIVDASETRESPEETDAELMQIDVFGISYPRYEELFPHHVRDYENA